MQRKVLKKQNLALVKLDWITLTRLPCHNEQNYIGIKLVIKREENKWGHLLALICNNSDEYVFQLG